MLNLYKNIKKRRLELEMTQTELAKKTGYADKSMIAKIESGKVDITQSKIVAFANALNTTPGELMGFDATMDGNEPTAPPIHTLPSAFPNIFEVDVQRVPMLGSVSCGVPRFADVEFESYTLKGTGIKCDFCLRASGESMSGIGIHDGDMVFCREQSMVDNGDVAAVAIGDEAVLKRFYYYKEQGLLVLRPENPDYPELVYSGAQLEEVHVLGKAVASQHDIR